MEAFLELERLTEDLLVRVAGEEGAGGEDAGGAMDQSDHAAAEERELMRRFHEIFLQGAASSLAAAAVSGAGELTLTLTLTLTLGLTLGLTLDP